MATSQGAIQSGGGQATAAQPGSRFLGTLSFKPGVLKACDSGSPLSADGASFFARGLKAFIGNISETIG